LQWPSLFFFLFLFLSLFFSIFLTKFSASVLLGKHIFSGRQAGGYFKSPLSLQKFLVYLNTQKLHQTRQQNDPNRMIERNWKTMIFLNKNPQTKI